MDKIYQKNTPRIRFNGFQNDWVEKEINDLVEFINKKIKMTGELNYVSTENMFKDFGGYVLSKTSNSIATEVRVGDILMSNIRPYLRKIALSTFNGGCSTDIICLRSKDVVNNSFLVTGLKRDDFIDYVMSTAKGTKMPRGDRESIGKYQMFIPDKLEQKKIADFFETIDNRIETQEQIIENLEQLKKGYMQKIFSQQLRFKDANGEDFPEWEEVMIGDIATLKNGYSFKSDSYDENGTYNIITIGNVTGDKYINVEKSNKIIELPSSIQKHQILKQNDILVSLTGNVGRVSLNKGSNNLLNQRVGLIEVNGNISPMFIYYCLSLKEFEKSMNNSGNGLAQLNIGKSTIEEYTIFVPNLVEQEIIVSLLELLDEKIDTEKTKLINLQKLKLGYLQQMFI